MVHVNIIPILYVEIRVISASLHSYIVFGGQTIKNKDMLYINIAKQNTLSVFIKLFIQ